MKITFKNSVVLCLCLSMIMMPRTRGDKVFVAPCEKDDNDGNTLIHLPRGTDTISGTMPSGHKKDCFTYVLDSDASVVLSFNVIEPKNNAGAFQLTFNDKYTGTEFPTFPGGGGLECYPGANQRVGCTTGFLLKATYSFCIVNAQNPKTAAPVKYSIDISPPNGANEYVESKDGDASGVVVALRLQPATLKARTIPTGNTVVKGALIASSDSVDCYEYKLAKAASVAIVNHQPNLYVGVVAMAKGKLLAPNALGCVTATSIPFMEPSDTCTEYAFVKGSNYVCLLSNGSAPIKTSYELEFSVPSA